MKLIIDIPEEVLKSRQYCQYFGVWSTKLTKMIENGKPYEENKSGDTMLTNEELKDFAKENFENGYEMAKAKYERPQKETTECSVGISEMADGLFDKLMKGGAENE